MKQHYSTSPCLLYCAAVHLVTLCSHTLFKNQPKRGQLGVREAPQGRLLATANREGLKALHPLLEQDI